MFKKVRSFFSKLSNVDLRKTIKQSEEEGYTGRSNSTLHALNCEQTDRLSDQEIQELIEERTGQGKPVGKLLAAARNRGLSVSANLSDTELRSVIKEHETQGYTGRSNSTLHALNCAQTDRLSNSQVTSLIAQRTAEGKPVGKLLAAARNRGI